jgi:uncharacterized membrane protein
MELETMTLLAAMGLAVTAVGLGMAILGSVLAVGEVTHQSKDGTKSGGLPETLAGLAKFAEALAKHPVGIRLVFLGILLVIIGATMSGVSVLMG